VVNEDPVYDSLMCGMRIYELSNHLGNVLSVISDKKVGVTSDNTTVDYYVAEVLSQTDYYPFGMQMPGRTLSLAKGYRYGFNGKENDNEVKGDGLQYDYGMRIYDPRTGKFLSVDPLGFSYPWWTPYQFAGNTPIQAIDLDGGEPKGYKWTNPYVASHPGSGVKYIPSQYDNQAWMVGINGAPKQLMHVYAVQDINKKTYLIYETATGAKAQWYIEYDKNGYKGDVNSFTWSTPPDPSDVLYAITVGPLVALPGLLTYGPALLRYLAIETGKEIVEEAAGVPIFDGPIDAIKQYEKRKLTKEAIKQSFEHLGKNTEESVRKKLKDYVLNTSHPVGGSKAKWFKSALGFTQENMDDLAKQIKFDKSKAIKTELTEYGQKYNQVINITGANGKKIDVTFGFIENKDGVVRMTTAIPTKQ
jgi:RHS repeat-associated protein